MSVVKHKTDHFSVHQLHSNCLQKTMNPVLITQDRLASCPRKINFFPSGNPVGKTKAEASSPHCPLGRGLGCWSGSGPAFAGHRCPHRQTLCLTPHTHSHTHSHMEIRLICTLPMRAVPPALREVQGREPGHSEAGSPSPGSLSGPQASLPTHQEG